MSKLCVKISTSKRFKIITCMIFYGSFHNKIYIRWRLLFALAFTFWLGLCLHSTIFIDPKTKLYYSESDENAWLSEVSNEEISINQAENNIKFSDNKYSFDLYLVIWNFITFLITFILCWLVKTFRCVRNKQINEVESINGIGKKESNSKIPISLSTNPPLYKDTESSINMLKRSSNIDFCTLSSKFEWSRITSHSKQVEEKCIQLQKKMIMLQADAFRKQTVFSKDVETLNKDKRCLREQLTILQKENHAANQQLEKALSEKNLFISQLECASKQLETNTKLKELALVELEEFQSTINSLQHEIENVIQEKEVLEEKQRAIDGECVNLKVQLANYEKSRNKSESNVSPRIPPEEPYKKLDFVDMSQPHTIVQNVQMRLINLEKSLDKLKTSKWHRTVEKPEEHKSSFTNADLITTQPEYPLKNGKGKSEYSIPPTDLTDEQRRNIFISSGSSEDEYFDCSKQMNGKIDEYVMENQLECAAAHRTPSNKKDLDGSNYFETNPVNENSLSPNQDNTGIKAVELQKFLQRTDCFERIDHLFLIPTNIY